MARIHVVRGREWSWWREQWQRKVCMWYMTVTSLTVASIIYLTSFPIQLFYPIRSLACTTTAHEWAHQKFSAQNSRAPLLNCPASASLWCCPSKWWNIKKRRTDYSSFGSQVPSKSDVVMRVVAVLKIRREEKSRRGECWRKIRGKSRCGICWARRKVSSTSSFN